MHCYEGFKRFKVGRLWVPLSEAIDLNWRNSRGSKYVKIVRSNRRLTVREIAHVFHISIGSCHHNLTEKLGMHPIAKFASSLLTQDQKDNRILICRDLFWILQMGTKTL